MKKLGKGSRSLGIRAYQPKVGEVSSTVHMATTMFTFKCNSKKVESAANFIVDQPMRFHCIVVL